MDALKERHCVNCQPGTPALDAEQQRELGLEIPQWTNEAGARLKREFRFPSYAAGITWVQEVAKLADREKHHPDLHIYYRKVVVELWTHTVNGLSDNDYILAAKIDAISM